MPKSSEPAPPPDSIARVVGPVHRDGDVVVAKPAGDLRSAVRDEGDGVVPLSSAQGQVTSGQGDFVIATVAVDDEELPMPAIRSFPAPHVQGHVREGTVSAR